MRIDTFAYSRTIMDGCLSKINRPYLKKGCQSTILKQKINLPLQKRRSSANICNIIFAVQVCHCLKLKSLNNGFEICQFIREHSISNKNFPNDNMFCNDMYISLKKMKYTICRKSTNSSIQRWEVDCLIRERVKQINIKL